MGGNTYTEAIQKELHVPFDSAEQLKRGVSARWYGRRRRPSRSCGPSPRTWCSRSRRPSISSRARASDRIDRIVLTGGSSLIEGFREALDDRFGTPVELLDPFKRITFDAVKLATDQVDAMHTAAVAVGLALRRSSDR